VQYYASYLKALAEYNGVTEPRLDPKHFDLENEKAELLLISQVYWDLSKAYDRSPGLQAEAVRCLAQFSKFTLGMKHQHINAQVLKKYLAANQAINKVAFSSTLEKIYVNTKGCFIATHSFGDEHWVTDSLRTYKKDYLSKSFLGLKFISFYYEYSPSYLMYLKRHRFISIFIHDLVIKKIIFLTAFFVNFAAKRKYID